MRFLTLCGVLTLITALGFTVKSAAMQNPGGSYQQTCRDIGVRGSTLSAECRDEGGNWRRTELQDFQRCGGDIQNLNGNLSCTGGGNRGGYDHGNHDQDRDRDRDHDHDRDHGRNGWPRGSYAQTCQNVNVSGNTLQASCQKKNGQWRNTSLHNYNRCQGDIINNNGKLQCR